MTVYYLPTRSDTPPPRRGVRVYERRRDRHVVLGGPRQGRGHASRGGYAGESGSREARLHAGELGRRGVRAQERRGQHLVRPLATQCNKVRATVGHGAQVGWGLGCLKRGLFEKKGAG